MFRISRRLDYGLQLMIALAQDTENRSQATATLADRLQIPLPFLHQIGRSLIQGRLIRATPGPHGGLRLNLPAGEITLRQVIETLEGPTCISACLDGEPCERSEGCKSLPVWNQIQCQLVEHLGSVRLSDMAAQPVSLPELATASKD